MKKRNWTHFGSRIRDELNSMSGVAGVGGAASGLAGLTIFAGTATASILVGGGAVLTIASLGYAIWKAVPPPMREPANAVGQSFSVESLQDFFPPLNSMAIVGPSRAGKTTLKSRLAFVTSPNDRTQSVSAYVVALPPAPQLYLALLDGGGETFAQQFKIAEPADCLCIIVDHNSSDSDPQVLNQRLQDHNDFFEQIRRYIRELPTPKKKHILILLNKKDLWHTTSPEQISALKSFGDQEHQKWLQSNLAKSVVVLLHSNESADDIATLISKIKSTITA